MHLGTGAITTECVLVGMGLSAAGLTGSYWLPQRNTKPAVNQIAAWGALVFAAQMVNVPIGSHSSAHLVGGVLLANVLGPAIGMRAMAIILCLQALLLGDGSLPALGVNMFNMAIMPALLVAAVERWWSQDARAMGVTAGVALIFAALLIPLEVAVGRSSLELSGWQSFFLAMLRYHAFAAVLEAMATMGMIVAWKKLASREFAWIPGVAMVAAILLAVTSSFIASSLPDGYEAAAQANMSHLLGE